MRAALRSVRVLGFVAFAWSVAACGEGSEEQRGSGGSSAAAGGSAATGARGGAGGAKGGRGGTTGTSGAGTGGSSTGGSGTGGSGGFGTGGSGTGGSGGSGTGASGAGGASGTGGAAGSDAGGVGSGGGSGAAGGCGQFASVTDPAMPGPLGFVSAAEGPDCTIWRPRTLGEGGVRHPVIIWGNGTSGPIFVYGPAFELWASHGFIVAGANVSNGQGSGTQMLACLAYVLAQDTTAGSVYAGKVCARAGASGHSQGGGGALMAGRDARVTTTAPLMPYIAQGFGGFDRASITTQKGPMLLLSGTADTIAPPATHQQPVYDTTNVPVFWANLVNGDHVAVSFGIPTYREKMLAWFRFQLMGDQSFRDWFYGPSCRLCADSAWQVQRKGIN